MVSNSGHQFLDLLFIQVNINSTGGLYPEPSSFFPLTAVAKIYGAAFIRSESKLKDYQEFTI